MNYIEADLILHEEFAEILVAELAEIGFESFIDHEKGMMAYVQEELFDDVAFKQLIEKYAAQTAIHYSLKKIEKQNWNAEWESNFEPIEIENLIRIRADFHPSKEGFEHEIIITPKMSFGTGHHETTAQVMLLMTELDFQNKTVIDVGTGTGILAVLAEKLGAKDIVAFDIDEWSVENTLENIGLNNCNEITVNQGTIQSQEAQTFDFVLANINRNILLDEIKIYQQFMKPGAYLLLSGFYEKDIADIEQECEANNLKKIKAISKKEWAAVVFKK